MRKFDMRIFGRFLDLVGVIVALVLKRWFCL